MGADIATTRPAASQPSQAQELTQSERMFLKLPADRQSSFLEDLAKKDPAKCVKLYNLLTEAQQGKISSRAVDAVMGAAVALEKPAEAPAADRGDVQRRSHRAAQPNEHLEAEQKARPGQTSIEDGLVGRTRQGAPIYDPKALKRIQAAEMADLKEQLKIDAATEKKAAAEIRAEKDAYDKKNKVNLFNKKDHATARDAIEMKIKSKYGLDQVENLKAKHEAEKDINKKRMDAAGIKTTEDEILEGLERGARAGGKLGRWAGYLP